MNDLVQRPDLSDVVPERLTEILERERQRQFLEQLQILRHPARADRVDAQIDHQLVGHSLFPSPRNIARSADYGVPSRYTARERYDGWCAGGKPFRLDAKNGKARQSDALGDVYGENRAARRGVTR